MPFDPMTSSTIHSIPLNAVERYVARLNIDGYAGMRLSVQQQADFTKGMIDSTAYALVAHMKGREFDVKRQAVYVPKTWVDHALSDLREYCIRKSIGSRRTHQLWNRLGEWLRSRVEMREIGIQVKKVVKVCPHKSEFLGTHIHWMQLDTDSPTDDKLKWEEFQRELQVAAWECSYAYGKPHNAFEKLRDLVAKYLDSGMWVRRETPLSNHHDMGR